MNLIKRYVLPALLFTMGTLVVKSQILEPVKWSFSAQRTEAGEANLVLTATIEDGWYLYSQYLPEGGPVATNFNFKSSPSFTLAGKVTEPKPTEKYDNVFEMDLKYFKGKVDFIQKVRTASPDGFVVEGFLEFMCCNDISCLSPSTIDFEIKVPPFAASAAGEQTGLTEVSFGADTTKAVLENRETSPETAAAISAETANSPSQRGLWYILLAGFLGGLLALVTPCVFPMIPMTVSYFLRGSANMAKGRRDAIIYGISIVVIYVALGLGVSLLFGADKLNQMATSPVFNIFFFLLLIIFAAAFFGAFELTLPSKWTTAIDNKADKTGGLLGVFLMALTLVLVSFSCTGPIIGTLLVEAAVSGSWLSPLLGMTGFAVALAIPFTLLAIFPSWLSSMPKSGGWLNSVKVILAFLLLAFSLKFLSVADAVGQWGLLSRDAFLATWITIFVLMGLYLLGKLRFHHDSELPYVSVPRLLLALASFAFALYMLPGLWGAPLKTISSFAPPISSQVFDISKTGTEASPGKAVSIPGDKTKEGAYGLIKFLDYEQGMQYARQQQKPVLLDFTGLGCVNCRKMEAAVWSDPQVQDRLRNNFVIISLYVDDRTDLPESEQYISNTGGRERRIRTVGSKWSDFQAKRFGVNSQPYYVILGHDEQVLSGPYGFNTDVKKFISFLDKGSSPE